MKKKSETTKKVGGRPAGPLMPCGWKCGESLTAREMRTHFVTCPKRPEKGLSNAAS